MSSTRINSENIIIFILMIAVIGYQQWQIRTVKKKLVKELTTKIDSINVRIEQSDRTLDELSGRLIELQKKDKKINLQVYNLRKKLKQYEKSISQYDVDRLTRDSIRRILTE